MDSPPTLCFVTIKIDADNSVDTHMFCFAFVVLTVAMHINTNVD